MSLKAVLLLIFLTLVTATHGISQANLDSLWQVWNNQKNHDTTRLSALGAYSWDGYLFSRPDSAFYFAQIQYEYAIKTDQKAFQAEALKTQAVSFNIRGQHDTAISYYDHALSIYKELSDPKGIGAALNGIGSSYRGLGQIEKAIEYYRKSLDLCEANNDLRGIANGYNNIGIIHYGKGEFDEAIDQFLKSVEVQKKAGDKVNLANSLNNIGTIFKKQGNYVKAISFFKQSMRLRQEMDDMVGYAASLNNIGVTYEDQEDFQQALNFYKKGLEIRKKIGDEAGEANSISNIGVIYTNLKNYEKALTQHHKSLAIRQKLNDKQGIANSYLNISTILIKQNNLKGAKLLIEQSLSFQRELNNAEGIAQAQNQMGQIYLREGKLKQAKTAWEEAYTFAKRSGSSLHLKTTTKHLWSFYKQTGSYEDALKMHEEYVNIKDSIENENNQKAVIRQEYQYAYEKQAATDSIKTAAERAHQETILEAEKEKNKLKEQKSKQEKLVLYAGLALAILIGFFVFQRFRVTKRHKDIIEAQKVEVEEQKEKVDLAFYQLEEKNNEILDSITYAKRIQTAILPPNELFIKSLPNSFVFYKPKDIVAGDFYWLESCNDVNFEGKSENLVLFAAADCTGHGVPGAMVSVVCNNSLNRSVREYGLTDPGKILDKTRELVIQEFEKSNEEVKDGMDIALVSLKGKVLQYAGAHNPLWIIRKDSNQIEEIKADKQPIGKYADLSPYTTHERKLNSGDSIYIFSDGYADQFGGQSNRPGGKKFKSSNFKKLLISISNEHPSKQRDLLESRFNEWKGLIEQLDDVCVIGVRI